MNANVFKQYSNYYDLLYQDKDYVGEVEYVAAVLRKHVPNAKSLLEFGSGTGRHGRLIASLGFDVLGIELSGEMVARAAVVANDPQLHQNGAFECVEGDIRTSVIDRTFDAVLALFHVLSYQTTNEQLLETFGNASRHLINGGIFLFDVWHGPAVLSERPAVRVKRVENACTRLTRIAEPTLDSCLSIVTVDYTILAESKVSESLTSFSERHQMRYLFPVEVAMIARNFGFVVERSEEFLTGMPLSERTWGATYVLRKVSDKS